MNTIFTCPLCEWRCEVLRADRQHGEEVRRQHLSSHTPAEWAATVILLQHRIDGLQGRLSRLCAL